MQLWYRETNTIFRTPTSAVDGGQTFNSRPSPLWRVEVDCVAEAEWSQLLDCFEDANIYQTWSYGAVRWGQKNLSHIVLKRDDKVVAMAQLRIVRPSNLNFGMGYLRWGPLCQRREPPLDIQIVQRMAAALEQEYVNSRKLLLKILPNAFEGSSRAQMFQSTFSNFRQESFTAENTYRTFVLDLAPSLEELRRSLDKKWRNQLTRAENNGLNVVAGSGTEEYRRFCVMYRQMRDRKTFESSVDIEEFAAIQANLSDPHRMRVFICEQNGVPAAGLVASAIGDSAIYLLGATSDAGLQAKGSYLLQWNLIQWLKGRGVRWYDLGGIDPEGNPGVYHFKHGLSGADLRQLAPFTACTNVVSSAIVKMSLALDHAVRGFSFKTALR